MGGKQTKTARVPCHPRFATRLRPSTDIGSERKITSPNARVSDVSMFSAIAKRRSRQSRLKTPLVKAICRASSSVSAATMATPAGPGEVVVRSGRQAEQRARPANLDRPFRNDLKLVSVASHQSTVRGRRIVNSMRPSGSSRHRSTSLM
jgi:hypothetical protein